MKNNEIDISTKNLLGMLSNYYTLKYNKPIKVKERHFIGYEGYPEYKTAIVEFYYKEEVEILGHTATKTKILSADEIKDILNELIDNYTVESLTIDASIEIRGYYMGEHEEAVFRGVTLNLKEKQKELRK